jgi:ATP phosphoribosyltransferase regulatory subunit
MAIECLEAVGVEDFVLALGHAGVVTSLLDEAGFAAEDPRREQVLISLSRRDPLSLAEALRDAPGSPIARRALVGLGEDNGMRQSLEAARELVGSIGRARAALAELESVTRTLVDAGLEKRVAIDLSESRSLDYYTGLVFRIYGEGLGFDVGGGGRYDTLLGRLGRPMPAIGFMLGLDRLALLVERSGRLASPAVADGVGVRGGSLGEAVLKARALRAAGKSIRFEGRE